MKMKKGRRLISILMLLIIMVSVPATSVLADGNVGRVGQGKVESIAQAYTGGNSQVYAHLITRADGSEVRYVYSKNYLCSDSPEDTFAALKSVLSADYAALIPDSVDASRVGSGFFFCSDPSLEKSVNDNWTSAEYAARNFLTVNKEGTSYTYKCEGEGAGGAVNTSATAARQNNRFEWIKELAEAGNHAKWEAREEEKKAAWDAAEAEHHNNDPTYTPVEYQRSTYVPLDFGELTGDDIQGKRDITDTQIDLAVGCSLKTSYSFEQGKLVEVTNITIIDHVATIYSEHATIVPVHVHSLVLVGAKEAACTEKGNSEYYTCESCDLWFEDAAGAVEITDKDSVIKPALGHNWGAWKQTKAPTAENAGVETRTCSRCGEEEIRSIPASGRRRSSSSGSDSDSSSDGKADRLIDASGKTHNIGSGTVQGEWKQSADGSWHFEKTDGTPATGWNFLYYNNRADWYFFDDKGTMQTGWLVRNGSRYYLNPVSDGHKGAMLTGWQEIDGKLYYFETVSGQDQGHLYVNTRTPDGYWVGADGAWDGRPKESGR